MPKLNPIAQSVNEQLEKAAPEVLGMLSEYGRRLYFPKGIISQTAEAKQKATRFNATIGIATEEGSPMILPSIASQIGDVSAQDAVTYAPARTAGAAQRLAREAPRGEPVAGRQELRTADRDERDHPRSVPGGRVFFDPGDVMLLPDKLWGNYRLTFEVHHGAEIQTFPFYKAEGGMDTDAFATRLRGSRKAATSWSCCSTSRTTRPATCRRKRKAMPAAALEAQAEKAQLACSVTTPTSGSSTTWAARR